VNGKGQLATGAVAKIGKKSAEVEVSSVHTKPAPNRALILIQAIPRRGRLDTILEKGTELGATEFWLFPGERSERKVKADQLERFSSVTVAALKQCGRLYLPEIRLLPGIQKWKDLPERTYYGDFSEGAKPLTSHSQAAIVIGPESGLTEQEIDHLRSLGAEAVTLHDNILRTDTAAICALALLSQ